MPYKVIAVHTVIHVPEGSKKQESVAPGTAFTLATKADYEHLKAIGAVKDAGKAPAASDDGEAAKAAAAEAAKAAEQAAAEAAKKAEEAEAAKKAEEAEAAKKAEEAKKAADGKKGDGKKAGAADDVVG